MLDSSTCVYTAYYFVCIYIILAALLVIKLSSSTRQKKNSKDEDEVEGGAGVVKADANATEADLHKRMVSSEKVEVTFPHVGDVS